MSIISVDFFILVALSTALYWCFPPKIRWTVLLVASSVFVCFANGFSKQACLVMFLLIMVAYFTGIIFKRYEGEKTGRRVILLISLLIEGGLLIYLKDLNFFLNLFNLNSIDLQIHNLIAPLGVSYFTLSLIGYILDSYWKMQEIQTNPFKFLLFGSYFPLLTSGPIVRYSETGDELFKEHQLSYKNLCFGVQRIIWGIFKKIVLAERLSIIVNTIYGDSDTYQGLYIWIAMLCFVLQLYADFSGCLDVVYGVSDLFGISLPENFDLPFLSKSISEFWRRWHITLGLWLKNYILYPILKSSCMVKLGTATKKLLGKKYGKKIPTWCGLFISWFIIGFWHGGTWNYIIGVGLWMWLLIVLGDALESVFKIISEKCCFNTNCFSWRLFQIIRTWLLFGLGLGMFPASGFISGLKLYKSGFSVFNPWIFFDGSFLEMGLTSIDYDIIRFSVLIVIIAGIIKHITRTSVREWISQQNVLFRWSIWIGLILVILVYGEYGPGYDAAEFIYRGF